MAAKRGGHLLAPHGEDERNGESRGVAVDGTEETIDVSASLFKEISSEEEIEEGVLTGMDGEILGVNGAANADFEGETSGEDGSLFEEIGGDDSHYGGLGEVQHSVYDRAANGDSGAGYVNYSLGGTIRFQTEDVPFIRAVRRDLDGPLDGPLASLQREDGASLDAFGEKLSSIFEDMREREESTSLAGISRNYGSSSDDGVDVPLAGLSGEGDQESLQLKVKEVEVEPVQEIGVGLLVPGEHGTDEKIVPEVILGEQPEVSILPPGMEGIIPALGVVSSSPREAPRKRGRASRELGALLMDAQGNGRGKRAVGLPAAVSDAFALAVVRGTTEAGSTVNGINLEPSEGLGSRVEIRITRSKASGRLASKNENLDGNGLDGIGTQDKAAKRTGKRSAARGGRLGWGNGHDSCTDGSPTVEEGFVLPVNVPGEGQVGAGFETGQVGEDKVGEGGKGPENKSASRAKKARGKGKQSRAGGESEQLGRSTSHLIEPHTGTITTDTTQNVRGCEIQSQIEEVLTIPEMQSQIEEVLTIPPSAEFNQEDALCNLDALETEPVESVKALESSAGGRRRSNRQKGKAVVQPEADKLLGRDALGKSNQKQRKKGTLCSNDLPQIPAGILPNNLEELAEPVRVSEQSLDGKVGDYAKSGGTLELQEELRPKGRKTGKGKGTGRKGLQTRNKKHVQVSGNPPGAEGCCTGGLGADKGSSENITDAELILESGTSAQEAGPDGQSLDPAPQNGLSRLEIGVEGCLDTSKDKCQVEGSACEQGEGLANLAGRFEETIQDFGTSAQEAGPIGESLNPVQQSGLSRPEIVGEEGCLDAIENECKVEGSVCERSEGLANLTGEFEEKILLMKVSDNAADSALVLERDAFSNSNSEEGIKELRNDDTLPGKLEARSLSPGVVLAQIIKTTDKAEIEVGSTVIEEGNAEPMKVVMIDAVEDCGAGASAHKAVKGEKEFTSLNESCNVRPSICGNDGDDAGSATVHDSTTKKEGMDEQPITEQKVSEAVPGALPGAKDQGIVEIDGNGASENVTNVSVSGAGRGRSRKGCVPRQPKVDTNQAADVSTKGKGRGKKRAVSKKENVDATARPTIVGVDAVIDDNRKTSTPSRRGKRKLISEAVVVGIAEASKEISMGDGIEPCKDTMVDVKDGGEKPKKNVKRTQKGRSTTIAVEVGVAKKKRKTGKLQEPQANGDAFPAATVVTANGEGPTEVIPSGSGCELKASKRGKAGLKKSEKAITGSKVAKSPAVGGKTKRVRKPPTSATKSRGATMKVLSSIKDQGSEEGLPSTRKKKNRPEVAKGHSQLQEGQSDRQTICDGDVAGVENGVAAASALLNQETIGADSVGCSRLHATTEVQGGEVPRDLDSGAVGEDVSSGVTEGGENKGSEKCIDSVGAETGAARKSWVLCDDCNKWRCIPVELADQIESTNARWSCRENPDKAFQDCSVPQEKSNAEINAELQISEVSVCEEGDDRDAVDSKSMNLGATNEDNKPAVWKRIQRNIFHHRRRKVLEIDEMMVCQCAPPEEGEVGCGDNCLNRMLSIECVAEQCPCGEGCSNQQFQNRTYAPIDKYRCGKKGFGLRVTQNISKGTFIIEYVGEVLDVSAFEARQQEYARKGQKHFYFMTLNTNEVIDACSKGNFGRFINHSCDPNCRTEKWMVDGEVCIGLFAVRDIAKDEEVTFDYNYVRVCGAAAKKCECGSSQCRGFIGGDPLTPKAVVESDSEDEEDLEPIMVENSEDEDAYVDENKLAPGKKPRVEAEFHSSSNIRTSGLKRKLTAVKDKAPSMVKRFKTSSTTRRSSSVNYKGLTLDVSGGRHEGPRTIYFSDVREKLDVMLDRNGGLKRRRDAAKQYLKLLVLTSASGDNRKDATACSVRDLSLLLEALLKTTSHTVLSDIMHKNGLRMLHNLIKQLRKTWDKTPILRKLIKVLELLASERVLTIDLINSRPPRHGMESFQESLFELTRHKDAEVVQMARRFRNRWMPPRSQLHDQHYRGYEKPLPGLSMQSLSPVVMLQSDQLNLGGNRYQSPQHPKQAFSTQPLTVIGSEVSRPGSSELPRPQGGSLPASQSHNGLACMEEGAKDDGAMKSSMIGDDSNSGKPEQATKKTRKRPSRWDAPAKVEKSSKEPSDPSVSANQSDPHGVDSRKLTLLGTAHSQSEGSRQFPGNHRPLPPHFQNSSTAQNGRQEYTEPVTQAPFVSLQGPRQVGGSQSTWPSSISNGFQDSARLANGGISGKPQIHPGSPAVVPSRGTGQGLPHLQGTVATVHLPGAPTMQMQMVPPPNAIHFGGPPLPGRVFPHGPSAAQGIPVGYPMGPGAPQMLPTGPYVQWGPPPVAPHFAVPPSFQVDPSQRNSLPATWPHKRVDDGSHRENFSVRRSRGSRLQAEADGEPEPPVPGLSPPPPPPPGQGLVPANWTGYDSYGWHDTNDMSQMEYCQERRVPLQYVHRRDRELGHEYYGPRDPDTRDEIGSFYPGEHWETPEAEGFREDVFSLVCRRVQKHHKLRTRDLDRFCSKMADVIVRKEVAKYVEHRNQGIEKIILKTKLVEKVDSYVDNQVGIYLRKLSKSHRS